MNDFKQKFSRKLKAKLKKTQEEYDETKWIFEIACLDFSNAIGDFREKNQLDCPFGDNEKDKKKEDMVNEEVFSDPEVKDLYKKIVISTHPDKLLNVSKKDKDEKTKLFRKASKAKGCSNLNALAEVAVELKIDLEKLTFEQLETIEQEINKKEKETDDMRKSIAWVWYYSNQQKRLDIIKSVFNNDGRGGKK